MVNFLSNLNCKRCQLPLTEGRNTEKFEDNRNPLNSTSIIDTSPNELKYKAWKKIKLGLLISIVGFAITAVAISLGFFEGSFSKRKVGLFSMITLLPLSAVLAGIIELITGFSIFDIVEKWEKLPQWLGWLIGIGVFFLIIFLIIFLAVIAIMTLQ
jgi:hypothetical protein